VTSSADRQEAEIPWPGRPVAEVDSKRSLNDQQIAGKDELLAFLVDWVQI